ATVTSCRGSRPACTRPSSHAPMTHRPSLRLTVMLAFQLPPSPTTRWSRPMTSSLTLDAAPLASVAPLAENSERADGARTAVDKAFEILAALPAGGQFVGVSELARSMQLSKSTVFRLLTTMERNGFVEREGGRYRLGRRLHDIGAQVYEPRPGRLHELLSPIMAALYEHSRETVHLGVLRDSEVVLLGRLHGRRTTPHALCLGSRFPAHCSAMGKALL